MRSGGTATHKPNNIAIGRSLHIYIVTVAWPYRHTASFGFTTGLALVVVLAMLQTGFAHVDRHLQIGFAHVDLRHLDHHIGKR